jgi:hypothetical protein
LNQKLAAFVQQIAPPVVWNAYQRMRRRAIISPSREFGSMATYAGCKPLLKGRFAELYEKYRSLNPLMGQETHRYVNYNVCFFADRCRDIPGDFVCAGVSHGVTPRIVFDYVDFPSLGKTLHLIDPFEGIVSNDSSAVSPAFNLDPDYVLRQYPPGAPIVLHRKRIPLPLAGPLAFVFSDTGNPAADAAALATFYKGLSPGGIFITSQYANNVEHYEPILAQLGISPFWLPSGQGVIFKS